MRNAAVAATQLPAFVLRFPSLFDDGRGFAFPCDEKGRVDLGALTPRARANYLAAQRAIGRDFGVPAVVAWH